MIKNELMKVLSDSVEEVKKSIMKRRVKQEVKYNNKNRSLRGVEKSYLSEDNSYMPSDIQTTSRENQTDEEANFEETILKLVDFAKTKVKYEDFTSIDKQNLIDLFVNNETTYSYIYKSLFPTKL
jgi:hypothetical protein